MHARSRVPPSLGVSHLNRSFDSHFVTLNMLNSKIASLTDFGEYPCMQEFSERNFLKVVTDPQPAGVIFPSPGWTEENSHWPASKELEHQRDLLPSPGWLWLRPGVATGRLIGGCIESLQHLRGTGFWAHHAPINLTDRLPGAYRHREQAV